MNKEKRYLIALIEQFHELGDLALLDIDDDDDDLNDRLNVVAIKIENAATNLFGEKINMDFGMIHALYDNKDEIIQTIIDYDG